MARLRNIDGVTRVSLSKSDKEATVASSGADRNAPTATGYCGKNNVPAFELIVFFEGAAAAATAPTPGAAAADPGDDHEHDPGAQRPRRRPGRRHAGDRRDPRRDPGSGRRRRGHPGARHLPARLDHPLTTVTKNKTLLIAVVAAAAATAAFWFLALAPKREEAAKPGGQDRHQADRDRDRPADAGRLPKVSKANYGKNYASVVRLGKAVPEDDDVRSLLVQLDAEAGGTHVDFRTVTIGGTGAASAADADAAGATGPTPPPGAVSVGSAGFSAMPFTFSFRGSFENLSSLLRPHGALRDAAQRAAERHGSPAAAGDAGPAGRHGRASPTSVRRSAPTPTWCPRRRA